MASYEYDRITAQYRDLSTGQFAGRATIQFEVASEANRLRTATRSLAQSMLDDSIDVVDFQLGMVDLLKESSLRMALFAKGGKENMDGADYLRVGRLLKEQYKGLYGFGKAIVNGELTEKQIIQRAGQYANVSTIAFHQAELVSKAQSGYNAAKRELDPQARHCRSCLDYHTDGQWLPIDEVVPSGFDCECGGNCRCRVFYRVIPSIGNTKIEDLVA